MKKWLVGSLAIFILLIATRVWASWDVSKITIDFKHTNIVEHIISGNYVVTNTVIDNGDTIQTNSFVVDGGKEDLVLENPAFTPFIQTLVNVGFPMATAVTNAATRGTVQTVGVYGFDTTSTDLGNSVQ